MQKLKQLYKSEYIITVDHKYTFGADGWVTNPLDDNLSIIKAIELYIEKIRTPSKSNYLRLGDAKIKSGNKYIAANSRAIRLLPSDEFQLPKPFNDITLLLSIRNEKKNTSVTVTLKSNKSIPNINKLEAQCIHISEMENGIRPIGKEMAKRFAELFKTDYRKFL